MIWNQAVWRTSCTLTIPPMGYSLLLKHYQLKRPSWQALEERPSHCSCPQLWNSLLREACLALSSLQVFGRLAMMEISRWDFLWLWLMLLPWVREGVGTWIVYIFYCGHLFLFYIFMYLIYLYSTLLQSLAASFLSCFIHFVYIVFVYKLFWASLRYSKGMRRQDINTV